MRMTLDELINAMEPQARKDKALISKCVDGLTEYAAELRQKAGDAGKEQISALRRLVDELAGYWGLDAKTVDHVTAFDRKIQEVDQAVHQWTPTQEHPQLLAADPICQRIGAAVSSGVAKPEQAEQKLPILLQDYKNHLHQGRFDRAMDAMELAAAMALSSALREFRQMGKVVSPQQGAERLRQSIQPHHNRGSLKNRADEIAMELQRILAQKASAGICGRESKESLAYRWLELAASCAKVPIRYEADQIKQRQKEEQAQRGAGPVME